MAACCVLHNICEIHSDAFDDAWIEPDNESDQNQPVALNTFTIGNTPDGREVREGLIEYFHFIQLMIFLAFSLIQFLFVVYNVCYLSVYMYINNDNNSYCI